MQALLFAAFFLLSGAAYDPGAIISDTGEENFNRPIDPDTYLIRPGEQLQITFIKAKIDKLNLVVNAEGKIVDETLGIIDLSGSTLSQVREILADHLALAYNAGQFEITTGKSRPVSIAVTGAVRRPGVYTGYTSWPVSRIIKEAGGITKQGSKRRITLFGGPAPLAVDLELAINGGESELNPFLWAGTNVNVPFIDQKLVQIAGEVNRPRAIELVKGDSIERLIMLAGGFSQHADRAAVKIISSSQDKSDKLSPGDIIFVPLLSSEDDKTTVSIIGEVESSGYYLFTAGMSLSDLIKISGGYTADASVNQTTVFRKAGRGEWERSSDLMYPISNFSIGKQTSGAANGNEFKLFPSDSVFVPTLTGFVRVRGAIGNPGLFPFSPGKNAAYYVNLAGGFLSHSDRKIIYRAARVTKIRTPGSPEITIYDGDEVIVETRKELQ